MSSREPVYLPQVSPSLLVPVDPSDSAIYRQRVNVIKGLITELEDENNLIAYKIAKTRRRIEEKKARLAAQQPVEPPRGFWGSSSKAILPASKTEKRIRPGVKDPSGPRAPRAPKSKPAKKEKEKEKEREGSKGRKAPQMSLERSLPPMSAEEISHLRGSDAHSDRMEDVSTTSRKASGRSQKARSDHRQSREADSMDIDDFDDY